MLSWRIARANSNSSEAASSSITDDNQVSSESILCYTGKSYTTSEVHEGGATMDWREQEDNMPLTGPPDQHH